MKPNPLTAVILIAVLSQILPGVALSQQVYKWTDAAGQVHYSQQKPGDATQAATVDIVPPATASSNADSAAEIARINALSDQMARERQAAEQARQEEAIRNLEQENQQLQNDLLKKQQQQQQQQQQNGNSNNLIIGPSPYPYPYSYPYSYPYPYRPDGYRPGPPNPPPCQPWPDCNHHHRPMPPPQSSRPLAKPNPPFHPAPVGVTRGSSGGFRGQ